MARRLIRDNAVHPPQSAQKLRTTTPMWLGTSFRPMGNIPLLSWDGRQSGGGQDPQVAGWCRCLAP